MKRYVFVLLALIMPLLLCAQLEVKEGSFKEVQGFVNISIDKMYDDNDVLYSVIKVKTENINNKQRQELLFEGNAATFIELEYKVGEVWVYLSSIPATYLKISHPDFGSTEYWFPYDLAPKKGYEMTLMYKPLSSSEIGYITVKSVPKGANVMIDNVIVGSTPYLAEAINVGNHKIFVSMDGYAPDAKRVNIEINKESVLFFELIADDNQKADLKRKSYINFVESTKFKRELFSVGDNKKVYFSQGNLQYQPSSNTWRFSEHQWDAIGESNELITSAYNGWIDLFGWGTGNKPTKTSVKNIDYDRFYDWGNSCDDDYIWRTMTKEEWSYVIDKRKTISGIRYAKAIVNGINGLILLPDNWDKSYYNLNNTNNSSAEYRNNKISKTDWINKFGVNGAVFLPVTGFRYGISVGDSKDQGYYWTSTSINTSQAYYIHFGNDYLGIENRYGRTDGHSVRLVRDVEH